MFNKKNIQALIEELKAHKERFNMLHFVQYGQPKNGKIWEDMPTEEVNIHDCKTVCCISGWIQIVRLKQYNDTYELNVSRLKSYKFFGLSSYQFLIDDTLTLSEDVEEIRRDFLDNLFFPRATHNIKLYGLRKNCPWSQAYKLGLLENIQMDEYYDNSPDFYAATADHAIAVLEAMIAGTVRPEPKTIQETQ